MYSAARTVRNRRLSAHDVSMAWLHTRTGVVIRLVLGAAWVVLAVYELVEVRVLGCGVFRPVRRVIGSFRCFSLLPMSNDGI